MMRKFLMFSVGVVLAVTASRAMCAVPEKIPDTGIGRVLDIKGDGKNFNLVADINPPNELPHSVSADVSGRLLFEIEGRKNLGSMQLLGQFNHTFKKNSPDDDFLTVLLDNNNANGASELQQVLDAFNNGGGLRIALNGVGGSYQIRSAVFAIWQKPVGQAPAPTQAKIPEFPNLGVALPLVLGQQQNDWFLFRGLKGGAPCPASRPNVYGYVVLTFDHNDSVNKVILTARNLPVPIANRQTDRNEPFVAPLRLPEVQTFLDSLNQSGVKIDVTQQGTTQPALANVEFAMWAFSTWEAHLRADGTCSMDGLPTISAKQRVRLKCKNPENIALWRAGTQFSSNQFELQFDNAGNPRGDGIAELLKHLESGEQLHIDGWKGEQIQIVIDPVD